MGGVRWGGVSGGGRGEGGEEVLVALGGSQCRGGSDGRGGGRGTTELHEIRLTFQRQPGERERERERETGEEKIQNGGR